MEVVSTQGIAWQHHTICLCAVGDPSADGTAHMPNCGTSLQTIARCMAQRAEPRESQG